ncbi:glycosyltransferase [Actinopolymorpha pittospori]
MFILFTASRNQSWDDKPIPKGRVVAAVPAYNEDPFALHACIRRLLHQTHPVDAIYVVDDGSTTRAPVLRDPRVHWKRTTNGGSTDRGWYARAPIRHRGRPTVNAPGAGRRHPPSRLTRAGHPRGLAPAAARPTPSLSPRPTESPSPWSRRPGRGSE